MSNPRRSPRDDERKRDPERTRERILDAALAEFGEHGYAGARISAIASRAGVNQQLISYYFNGKEGLYQALQRRWEAAGADSTPPDQSLPETVAGFVHLSVAARSWARLLVWDGLAGDAGRQPDDEAEAYFSAMVDDLRRRQRAGELAADLDPPYIMLMLFAAALAPAALPNVARRFTGLPADSPEFLDAYAEALRNVVTRLAGGRVG
jgi:AcrR family transcriptional regulator